MKETQVGKGSVKKMVDKKNESKAKVKEKEQLVYIGEETE